MDEETTQTLATAAAAPSPEEDAAQSQALRLRLCAGTLESALRQACLPAPLAGRVRSQFQARIFQPAELDAAIEDARALLGELQPGAAIAGPRMQEMVTSEERLQAAVDDLMGAPRDAGMAGKSVPRLSGIRELYLTMTGDYDLHGGFYRSQQATTATLPGLVKNALNKLLIQHWEDLGRAGYRWWEPLVAVEHFNTLQDISGTFVGEVGLLPEVAEGAEYTELAIADNTETGVWKKYGGYLPLTLELIDRDNLTRLRSYPRKLVNSSLRRISALVASIFSESSGTGPLMADGYHVFEAAHHKNLGTAALSATEWENAGMAIYKQEMLSGAAGKPVLALDPKYLLVPRELRLTGMRILYPSWEREAGILSDNLQKGEFGDVITVPDWTDANDWAAACDPRLAPAILVGERFGLRPEIFIAGDETSPALFANDELRIKIRHFISVFVADYRPLYKANVA